MHNRGFVSLLVIILGFVVIVTTGIYVVSQNKLVITDAFPAEDAEIISETKIIGRPRNMLVNKDRLVVFTEDDEQVFVIPEYDYLPRPRRTVRMHALVYDISDRCRNGYGTRRSIS